MSNHNRDWTEGRVQVYTGAGKGKTTAALGLTLRAAGAGLPVFFAQFIKGRHYHELTALERFSDLVTVRQYGRGCFIYNEPGPEDIAAAAAGLAEVREIVAAGRHRLVVLDEANCAVSCGLFPVTALLELIDQRDPGVELVFTGRGAAPELLARADLITEMQAVRHYFDHGIQARAGIET